MPLKRIYDFKPVFFQVNTHFSCFIRNKRFPFGGTIVDHWMRKRNNGDFEWNHRFLLNNELVWSSPGEESYAAVLRHKKLTIFQAEYLVNFSKAKRILRGVPSFIII
jgi:hypothetical protein